MTLMQTLHMLLIMTKVQTVNVAGVWPLAHIWWEASMLCHSCGMCSTDCAHAEVEAYMERSRSQAIPGKRLSPRDLPENNFAQAGDVLDDTNIEPVASEQHTGASMTGTGRSTSADANMFEEAADTERQTETRAAENGHSTSTDAHSDFEPAAEQQKELSVGNNGHGASEDAQTSVSHTESASGQEQQADIPALTAESQQDAVLPGIQAVSEASDYASAPERMEAVSEASDYVSIEPEPESDSAPEPAPESEPVIEAESEPASVPVSQPESDAMPKPESETAQSSKVAAVYNDADRVDADMDAAGQQPAATRADFAEIQKLLGHAASEGSNASTASHHQEPESAPRSAAQEDLAQSAPVDDAPAAETASAESSEPKIAAQSNNVVQQVQSEAQDSRDGDSAPEDETADSAPAADESARGAASASEATASSSSGRPGAGGFARLPSLPVRRGAPSLPARPSTAAGVCTLNSFALGVDAYALRSQSREGKAGTTLLMHICVMLITDDAWLLFARLNGCASTLFHTTSLVLSFQRNLLYQAQ